MAIEGGELLEITTLDDRGEHKKSNEIIYICKQKSAGIQIILEVLFNLVY